MSSGQQWTEDPRIVGADGTQSRVSLMLADEYRGQQQLIATHAASTPLGRVCAEEMARESLWPAVTA